MMKHLLKLLVKINHFILPSFVHKDLTKLNKLQKVIIAYRYWLALHTLKQ